MKIGQYLTKLRRTKQTVPVFVHPVGPISWRRGDSDQTHRRLLFIHRRCSGFRQFKSWAIRQTRTETEAHRQTERDTSLVLIGELMRWWLHRQKAYVS